MICIQHLRWYQNYICIYLYINLCLCMRLKYFIALLRLAAELHRHKNCSRTQTDLGSSCITNQITVITANKTRAPRIFVYVTEKKYIPWNTMKWIMYVTWCFYQAPIERLTRLNLKFTAVNQFNPSWKNKHVLYCYIILRHWSVADYWD